jgi:hypothetical protein
MEPMNDLIEQMVSDISTQVRGLDPVRLGLFLNWMCAHSVRVEAAPLQQGDTEELLNSVLKSWFESLSVQGMLWEYRLVMDELVWWRGLDTHRLRMLLKSVTGRRDG